ncbi:unnamed protein product [Heligmosomoides polygyrus]|uniref:Telomere length regulation protein conserved domain-containing protein n=1 Tax=Heligmosomoides polygyrus TaxID=6339 RepID=A0A3P7WXW5_HELPZ|nr:unnamed protein product [Heligmosomoides polygyrus]
MFAGSSPYVKPFRIRVGAAVMAEVEEGNGADEPSTLPQSDDIQLPSSSSCAVDALTVDSDDDEDFPAYEVLESEKHVELVGEEPEIKVPAPSYIRECMEHLDEKEKYEVFEAAFFAVNGMIRRKALGFVDISSKLVKKLVFLENKFSTKGFEVSLFSTLTSRLHPLCNCCAPSVVQMSSELFFVLSSLENAILYDEVAFIPEHTLKLEQHRED